jgi:tetratricopeptide (TPR) repeat protein
MHRTLLNVTPSLNITPFVVTTLLTATLGLACAQMQDRAAVTSGTADEANADLSWRTKLDRQRRTLLQSVDNSRVGGNATRSALAENLTDLGSVYYDQVRFPDAERCYSEAISIWAKLGSTDPRMGFALRNLAQLRLDQGRPSEAERLSLRAQQVLVPALGSDSVEVAHVNIGLAEALVDLHRITEAETAAGLAVATLAPRGQSEELGTALFLLARVALARHREGDAETLTRRAIEVWRISLGSQHPTYASGLEALAVLLSQKHTGESGQFFRKALEVFESQLGFQNPHTASTLLAYSQYLKSHGEKREAAKLKSRAEAVLTEYRRRNLLTQTVDVSAFRPERNRHLR